MPRLTGLVSSLLDSLPRYFDVITLIAVMVLLWGVMGVQLWGTRGQLLGRCRTTAFPLRWDAATVDADMGVVANSQAMGVWEVGYYAQFGGSQHVLRAAAANATLAFAAMAAANATFAAEHACLPGRLVDTSEWGRAGDSRLGSPWQAGPLLQ